jgi:hypothetical protein
MRPFIDEGGRPATWANLARWSAATLDEMSCSDVAHMGAADRRSRYTRRIAVMNLKKQPGGSICYRPAVREAAQRDATVLVEQTNLYRPHVTVAAGTFDVVQRLFDIPDNASSVFTTQWRLRLVRQPQLARQRP